MVDITSIEDLQALVRSGVIDFTPYGEVNTTVKGELILFNYKEAAQWSNRWNFLERVSRGLILNRATGEVVARPFDKFKNYGEALPDPEAKLVEITTKMDGSLIIAFRQNGKMLAATRGSFDSEQAQWATERLQVYDLSDLPDNLTLLFEAIYPGNRIVVDYGRLDELVLLGARDRFTGEELSYRECETIAEHYGFTQVMTHTFDSIESILAAAVALDANQEGWVLRYSDNSRFKVKGDAYKLAHKMLTGISFKWVLEAVATGVYEQAIETVPDEFLTTIKGYKAEIDGTVHATQLQIHEAWLDGFMLTERKEFAQWVMKEHRELSTYLFACYDKKPVKPLIYKHAFKDRENG